MKLDHVLLPGEEGLHGGDLEATQVVPVGQVQVVETVGVRELEPIRVRGVGMDNIRTTRYHVVSNYYYFFIEAI